MNWTGGAPESAEFFHVADNETFLDQTCRWS